MWKINAAARTVINHYTIEQMGIAGEEPGIDEEAKKAIQTSVKVISRFVNDLSRIPLHVAIKGQMSFNEASELLCMKEDKSSEAAIVEMMKSAEPSCEGNFTLWCTVHTFERDTIENIKVAPTLDEMAAASMTFKRFFNGKEIKKTQD